MDAITINKIFLLFLALNYIIKTYLDKRNIRHIYWHKNAVPTPFQQKIDLEDHKKAAEYSIEKLRASQIFRFISTIVILGWTQFGGLNYVDHFARSFGQSEIMTGLIFFFSFGVISSIIDLPQSLYTTFVLEEKYGFNKTTLKTFFVDMIKGALVSSLIGLPLLAGILWIMLSLGSKWWIYAWAFMTAVQLILIWAYPRFIAPIFNKFEALEEGEVKDKINSLLDRTGFESNGLFVMDASKRSSHGNAYFTGFGKNKRIVFFDTLLSTLDAEEVEAVLAHELGHFKKKHITKMLIKAIAVSFVGFAILGFLYSYQPFYEGHGVARASSYMAIALFTMLTGVYTFLLTPLGNITSRKHEYEADAFAAQYSDSKKLISALIKMYRDNASTLTPDPMYSKFYHSHPPALERVEHLEKLSKS